MSELPGADLVEKGLQDWSAGRRSAEALLVAIGAPRLARLGVALPTSMMPIQPEIELYCLLAADGMRDAHGRYLALVKRLERFERALERQWYGELRRRA